MSRARTGSYRPDDHRRRRTTRSAAPFDFPQLKPERETRVASRLGNLAAHQGRRIHAGRVAGPVRLSAQEPLAGLCRFALRRGRFGGVSRIWSARLVDFAHGRIGREGLLKKLSYIRGLEQGERTTRQLVRRLLACVYQATRNSGDVTRNAARTVAEALGAEYFEFDVDRVVQEYNGLVSRGIGRELDWKTDDLALQNIQARARAPSVWMLANIRRALLLATSNRSEAAVGYATMDGDTSGGLSPIAGIDKAFIRRWLRWCETHGPDGIGPLPELAAVNDQAPTAELRPPTAKQTDEDDLMPYELLDAIERAAIRDKMSPCEILLVDGGRVSAVLAAAARRLDRAVLPPLVPQPVEARALRPVASIWTTRISTPKPGAAFRFSPAATSASWRSCGKWPGADNYSHRLSPPPRKIQPRRRNRRACRPPWRASRPRPSDSRSTNAARACSAAWRRLSESKFIPYTPTMNVSGMNNVEKIVRMRIVSLMRLLSDDMYRSRRSAVSSR